MSNERPMNVSDFTMSSDFNALNFIIRSAILNTVNTAIPVRVDKIVRPGDGGGAGYLSATPLITQRDAAGNVLPPVSIPKLRWFRYQHGTAAVICDPKVGDIGLAVFAQQDVSTLNGENTPKQPGSFRSFDMSDGFYIGGFWGGAPTTFVRVEDDGNITIKSTQTVKVETQTVEVSAQTINMTAQSFTVTAPNIKLDGNVNNTLGMVSDGEISGNGIKLSDHVHSGVERGNSNTSGPS